MLIRTPNRAPARRGGLARLGASSLLAGLVAIASAAGPACAAPAPGPQSVTSDQQATTDAEHSASQRAATTGEPVPVPEDTDAFSTVTALPDGTLQKTISDVPERVHRDSGWVPVDATLTRNDDGSLSPTASYAPLRLSGGGTGPLAVLHHGDKTLSLSWPTALPTPSTPDPPPRMPTCWTGWICG